MKKSKISLKRYDKALDYLHDVQESDGFDPKEVLDELLDKLGLKLKKDKKEFESLNTLMRREMVFGTYSEIVKGELVIELKNMSHLHFQDKLLEYNLIYTDSSGIFDEDETRISFKDRLGKTPGKTIVFKKTETPIY